MSSKRDSECDNRRESEKSAWLSTDQPNHFILFSKQQGVGGGIFFLFFFFLLLLFVVFWFFWLHRILTAACRLSCPTPFMESQEEKACPRSTWD